MDAACVNMYITVQHAVNQKFLNWKEGIQKAKETRSSGKN
jgi:hypothetical protein